MQVYTSFSGPSVFKLNEPTNPENYKRYLNYNQSLHSFLLNGVQNVKEEIVTI